MEPSNAGIAGALSQIATALRLQKENQFKVRAYRAVAERISSLDRSLAEFVRKGGELSEIPGIGRGLKSVILEILETGTTPQLTRFTAELSRGRA